jgi:hypothetical protein
MYATPFSEYINLEKSQGVADQCFVIIDALEASDQETCLPQKGKRG